MGGEVVGILLVAGRLGLGMVGTVPGGGFVPQYSPLQTGAFLTGKAVARPMKAATVRMVEEYFMMIVK